MSLRFYNTLTRKKEAFEPMEAGKAGLYTCGPTIYNYGMSLSSTSVRFMMWCTA